MSALAFPSYSPALLPCFCLSDHRLYNVVSIYMVMSLILSDSPRSHVLDNPCDEEATPGAGTVEREGGYSVD